MADAAAKAGLQKAYGDISERIRQGIRWRPFVRVIQEGTDAAGRPREEVWDEGAYEVTREAMGWHIHEKEYGRLAARTGRVVEAAEIGPAWRPKKRTRWKEVWEETGARGSKGMARAGGRDDREETDDEQGAGAGAGEKRRVGTAMAARAGQLWELNEMQGGSEQGCAACCSRKRGWGWETNEAGERAWRGPKGQQAIQATTLHVIRGECEACNDEGRVTEEMRRGLQAVRKATAVNGRRGKRGGRGRDGEGAGTAARAGRQSATDGGAYAGTRELVAHAVGTLRGGADSKGGEALRRLIAGDLPIPNDAWRSEGDRKDTTGAVDAATSSLKVQHRTLRNSNVGVKSPTLDF